MQRHPGYLTHETVNRFLRGTVNKHLSSIGVAFPETPLTAASRINRKYTAKYAAELQTIRQRICLDGCEVAIDCGGYDLIQQGRLPFRLFRDFIDCYHEFLTEHSDLFNSAFHLDMAPGYTHNPFATEQDMSRLNYLSYLTTNSLPLKVRDRMMYIHHFRSPAILRVWRRLLFEDRLAENFGMFATGGLATSPEMTQLGCVAYALPLVDVIQYVKAERPELQSFRFHVLGDSDWKDLLPHTLLEEHIRAIHGLDVTITYDSSNLFQTIALARHTFAFGDEVTKLSLRSDELHKDHMGRGSQEHLFYEAVNAAVVPFGIRPLSPDKDPIYSGTRMSALGYTYAFLQQLAMFREVEDRCRTDAGQLYPIYQSGDIPEFERQVADALRKLHSGLTERDIPDYAKRITNSLQLIERLDLDEVASLVARLPEQKEFRP
jgi:hypothetical protein